MPAAPASIVLAMMTEKRRSPAARVDMPLKPNQPKNRMIVPRIAIGMW